MQQCDNAKGRTSCAGDNTVAYRKRENMVQGEARAREPEILCVQKVQSRDAFKVYYYLDCQWK